MKSIKNKGKEEPLALQRLTWEEARKSVYAVNSKLAGIIDKLAPSPEYLLYKASYPYGSQILQKGKLFLPTKDSNLICIENTNVNKEIQRSLGYNLLTNPVTLVLKNTLDLFVTLENRIINYSLIVPGNIFGLWRILDYPGLNGLSYAPISLWDMTAGARSIFMLPKIADTTGLHKLQKKYKIQSEKPNQLKDHWYIFKDIVNHPDFHNTWKTDLLFFSDKWFKHMEDPAWKDFKIFMLESTWKGAEFWRNQFTWDLTFSRIQFDRGLKPCPQVADIVNHLFAITVGAVPGFRPAIDNTMAPVKELQQVFEEEYGTQYAPIIIEPSFFSVFEAVSRPIYYSFNFHTAIRLSQKSSKRSSVVTDLYNVRSLLKKYLHDIVNDNLNISATPLHEMAKIVEFDFFHHDVAGYSEIFPSTNILKEDLYFQTAAIGCNNQEMPKNPPFLNGCVRVFGNKKN